MKSLSELENQIVSVERIDEYSKVAPEVGILSIFCQLARGIIFNMEIMDQSNIRIIYFITIAVFSTQILTTTYLQNKEYWYKYYIELSALINLL